MSNTAILVGNTRYTSLSELACCHDDLVAMKELLEATLRYSHSDIEVIENADADDLKARVREAIAKQSSVDELFFYFTGHGCQQDEDFYYCGTEFDPMKPNRTGISTNELHALLRMASADVVVKFLSGNPGFGRNEQGGDAVGHVQGGWRPRIGPRQARV